MPNLIPMERHPLSWWRSSMADWFDRVFSDRFFNDGAEESGLPAVFRNGMPALDVVDEGDQVRVTAELPGLEKDDFEVEVNGDRLCIRGERKSDREERKGEYYYSERSYGSFSRSVALPAEVDSDKAKATYKNGVLHITLPKTEAAKGRRITVE
jgi:HSP20 family protein